MTTLDEKIHSRSQNRFARKGLASWSLCLDRREAVRQVVQAASMDDVVVIAGKGHEQVQEIAGERIASGGCVRAAKGGHAWIGTSAGGNARILRTPDDGASWRAEDTPLAVVIALVMSAVASWRSLLIVGGDLGQPDATKDRVARSLDQGALGFCKILRVLLAPSMVPRQEVQATDARCPWSEWSGGVHR